MTGASGLGFRTVEWGGDNVRLLDQRLLPGEEAYLECRDVETLCDAISTLAVRGAPAIGVAAAMGVALSAVIHAGEADAPALIRRDAEAIRATRPTAVNLFYAIDRVLDALDRGADLPAGLIDEALAIEAEDVAANAAIGRHGAALIPDGSAVLTHCNAGALACAGIGTALGVIRTAWERSRDLHVFADETRPLLQGARLTAWELMRSGIPVTLITDNMAGHCMQRGLIDVVVVGADRIAANGDTANKIGTYSVSVLAREHGIPFYIAAPLSTLDLATPDGPAIVIEERDPDEVRTFGGCRTAPAEVPVFNPAFDVTPAANIAGIITEAGVARAPYGESLAGMAG